MAVMMTIDGKKIEAEAGMTILEAAAANDIRIPTLCYLKERDPQASCRLCVVEVEGARTFQPSCATTVREGMVVRTDTEELRRNRKLTLELIMAHHPVDCHHCMRIGSSKEEDLDPMFCEMCFWCDCVRDGICELQKLNREYHVDRLPFELEGYRYPADSSLHSVIRDPNKCIKCRRCIDICNNVQTVHNLALKARGQEYRVTASMDQPMAYSPCVRCGRCVDVCPTGAVYMEEHIDEMLFCVHSYDTKTVGMVSSSLLGEMENLCGMPEGSLSVQKIVSAMHKLGVDYVISEEQAINASRKEAEAILEGADAPVVISNSFAVKNFVKSRFADLADRVRYYSSVQESFAKEVGKLADRLHLPDESVKTVVFTANNENGAQAREENTVDFSMNAREIYRIFLRTGVDLCRTVATDALKQDPDPKLVYGDVTGPVVFDHSADPEVRRLNGKLIAVAHNLGQSAKLLEEIRAGNSPYDVIRLNG
ncbi:MAG: (2Fe-2S)-binding protein [Clostridia bacterium]|nr:(2Fe-2S)-binding protein [Clostridia bacterium]